MTWQWWPALGAGIFFELLWLDAFPAGTYIPPHGLAALCTSLIVLHGLGMPSMRMTTLIFVASCLAAYGGAWLEQAYRTRQNRSYTALLRWNRKGSRSATSPTVLTLLSLTEQFFLSALLLFVTAACMLYGAKILPAWITQGYEPSWALLWILASTGAVLSLRIPKAYIVCALAVGLGLGLRLV